MPEIILDELEFDLAKVLLVIAQNEDLDEVFRGGKITIPYNMLQTMVSNGTFPDEILERAQGVFNHIILGNQKPRTAYIKLLKTNSITEEVILPSINPSIEPEEISSELPEDKPTNKLPKHYGKARILKDIEENNGKSELDLAMLALNDLRNIYAKLKSRCIKDKLNGTKLLTQADCRDILAVVRIAENKLAHILKK